jgi:hypothetical protein
MLAFLVSLGLMIALIGICVYMSVCLYLPNWIGHPQERQLVRLSQEAFLEKRSRRSGDSGYVPSSDHCVYQYCLLVHKHLTY